MIALDKEWKEYTEQEKRVLEGRATGSLTEALGDYTGHSDYYLRYSPLLRFSTEAIEGITEYSNRINISNGPEARIAINENGETCELLHFRPGNEAWLEVRGVPGATIQSGDLLIYDSEIHCLRKMGINYDEPSIGNAQNYVVIGQEGYSIVRVRLTNDVFVYNPLSMLELTRETLPPLPTMIEIRNIESMSVQLPTPTLSPSPYFVEHSRYLPPQLRPQRQGRVVITCSSEQPQESLTVNSVIIGISVQGQGVSNAKVWVGNRNDFEHPAGHIRNFRRERIRRNINSMYWEETIEIELLYNTQIEHNGDNGETLIYHPEINPRIKEAMFGSNLQRVAAFAHSPEGMRITRDFAQQNMMAPSAWIAEYMQEPHQSHQPFNPLLNTPDQTARIKEIGAKKIRTEKLLKALEGYYKHRCIGCDTKIEIIHARNHMRDDGKIKLEPFIDLWRKGVVQFFCCTCFSLEKRMTKELKARQKQVLSTIKEIKKHSDGSLNQDVDFILGEFYKTCKKEAWEILKEQGDKKRESRLHREEGTFPTPLGIPIPDGIVYNEALTELHVGEVVVSNGEGGVVRANQDSREILGVVDFNPNILNTRETAYQPGDDVPIITHGPAMSSDVIDSIRHAIEEMRRRGWCVLPIGSEEVIENIAEGTGMTTEQLIGNDENISLDDLERELTEEEDD